jgi:mitochondrial import inner membrane translocase subunit TIM44
MIASGRSGATKHLQHAHAVGSFASFASSPANRRATTKSLLALQSISTTSQSPSARSHVGQSLVAHQYPFTSCLPPSHRILSPFSRRLHISVGRLQQSRPTDEPEDSRRENDSTDPKAGQSEGQESSHSEAKDEESGEKGDKSKDDKKERDQPAPPPHGDKSPWQVFTETLRSEFKASKEWNESTKQLASSAHQFSESDSVRRARAAYDATAGAATSKTAAAVKSTGKVLGHGAAWTWDTKMVQGIRGGVNATGRGIEKVTRPVRETEAFQNIKDAVDDGSSSRYGGWVEKEERRKRRLEREMKDVKSGRIPAEKMEEDPKYEPPFFAFRKCDQLLIRVTVLAQT